MTEPLPLTPYDCDLRDYVWMPIDCNRLLTSETWVLGTAEEKVASLTLWMKSWHQVPAGSLPNNEKMLAHMSEVGARWPKVRDHALRGWIKCSDGRLYHPVVCEKATEAWQMKLARKSRTEAARAAKADRRSHVSAHAQPSVTDSVTEPATTDVTGSTGQDRTRQDQTRQDKTLPEGVDDAPRSASPPRPERGSRLPADWQPSEPAYEGATPQTLARFRDYWLAQPGQRGVKTDWQATWRNWCRRDAEDRKRAPPGKTSHLSTFDQNEALIRLARDAQPELRMIG